jgi:putative membrane protein
MGPYYWNDGYSAWSWILWFGFCLLLFSSIGNWGYTYRAHRRYNDLNSFKSANDILNERYAKGEIAREEYLKMKSDILENGNAVEKKAA